MHDDDNNITICTALYQSFGFFIIMSPAEGLHFSALVMTLSVASFWLMYFFMHSAFVMDHQGVIQDFEVEGGNEKSNQKVLLKKRSIPSYGHSVIIERGDIPPSPPV